jgi:hypothetical protein
MARRRPASRLLLHVHRERLLDDQEATDADRARPKNT